jgi:RNA polymerase sigma-70 factor (ECF subfamily)
MSLGHANELIAVAAPPVPPFDHSGADEAVLVKAAKRGDTAAFDEIVRRYEQRILRCAESMIHNREDAEEVVQESFAQAFVHLPSFREESRLYTWLVRITMNQALMRLRKRRDIVLSIDDSAGPGSLLAREIEDGRPSPEQLLLQQELQALLDAELRKIKPTPRRVFRYRDIQEFSIEETAQALGMSISAVKSALLRARLSLRESLGVYLGKSGSSHPFHSDGVFSACD